MKKLIVIILVAISINSYSQILRIKDFPTTQQVYDSGLVVWVDKEGLDSARNMRLATIAPKISYLDEETSDLNKDLIFLRITDGTTEKKAKLRLITPELIDLSATTDLLNTGYIFVNNDNSIGDRKMIYTDFLTDITTHATFDNAVSAIIITDVTENFILNLISDEVDGQDITDGVTSYCTLYMQRIGKQVSGIFDVKTTGTSLSITYTMPSAYRPKIAIRCFSIKDDSDNRNTISISAATGTIGVDLDLGDVEGFNNVAFSYVTD